MPIEADTEKESTLGRGIRHVEAGEWKEGLAALSDFVRRYSGIKKREAEVAEACLYSGLAYVGLGETSPAISQFAQALMRNPQIRIPAALQSKAALDAFEVARREAVAPLEPKAPGKRSALPFIVGGAVAAGAAIAVAGGGAESAEPNPIPPIFTATGSTGTPQLLILSAEPPSSSTISLRETAPLLTFVFNTEPSLPGRVQAFADLVTAQRSCLTGHSDVAAVDRTAPNMILLVNSWQITCSGGFLTTTMNVRLVDADANIPVSVTTYSGGYTFLQ
jgi:hypothetical protein